MVSRTSATQIRLLSGTLIVAALAVFLWFSFSDPASANDRLRGAEIPFHAEHEDFVGSEPPVCDILEFDGPLEGEIFGESSSISSKIRATFNQFGCQITGELEIMAAGFAGSGPFYGNVDGNVMRFTVTEETSDARRDRNFSGLIDGDHIKGQYSIPHSGFVSEWVLFTDGSSLITRLSDLRDSAVDSQQVTDIENLQNELAELLEQRTNMAADLEHQVAID